MSIILLIVFINCFDLSEPGYYKIGIDNITNIDLKEENVGFFSISSEFEFSLNLIIKSGEISKNITNFKKNYIFIQGELLQIIPNNEIEINFIIWIVPKYICPRTGYFYHSNDYINFDLAVLNPSLSFCLFSLTETINFFSLSYFPKNIDTNVIIYQPMSISGHYPPILCDNNCNYFKKDPFFISINPKIGNHFEMNLIQRSKIYNIFNSSCEINPISYIVAESEGLSFPGGKILNLNCLNSNSNSKNSIFLIILFIVSILFLFILIYILFFTEFNFQFTKIIRQDEGYLIDKIENSIELDQIIEKSKFEKRNLNNIPKFL